MVNKFKVMKYLKIFELYEDITITTEKGKLVITYQNKEYYYQTQTNGLDVSLDQIVKQPNNDFKITAYMGAKIFSQEIDLSKERYNDIINKFKSFFNTNKTAPSKIESKALPNTPGKNFNLILIK